MDTLIGTTLGGYTLIRFLGSGGMGSVYLAEDSLIGQQVAIKVVRTDDGDYPDASSAALAAERFKLEARAVASLDHLHILPLYRYGEEETIHGQRAYMVMQYRPEGSLWDWLRQRAGIAAGLSVVFTPNVPPGLNTSWPVELEEAGEYLRQAASALQYAHDRGIIHRDIKPANFLLRIDNGNMIHLLLSDFGLAKLFSSRSATSHIVGTPIFMAPEQFEGNVRPETDQYALAIMIYYMLAGRPPFDGEPIQLMSQHLSKEPPSLRRFNPRLPENIEAILFRALAKNPSDRYPSITAFAEDFTSSTHKALHRLVPRLGLPTLQQVGSVTPLPLTVNISSPNKVGIPTKGRVPQTPLPALSDPQVIPQVSGLLQTSSPPVQPPGRMFQRNPTLPLDKRGMSRRRALGWIIGGASIASVGSAAGIYYYLQQETNAQHQKVVQQQLPAHVLHILRGHNDTVTSIAWSPDGSQLASSSYDTTARLWAVGNGKNIVTYSGHFKSVLRVAWSPDGTLLASGGADQTVQIWDDKGVVQNSFSKLGAAVSDLAWNDGGKGVFIATLGEGVRELIVSTGVKTGRLFRAIIHAIALSPDQKYLALAFESGSVAVIDLLVQPRKTTIYQAHAKAALALNWSADSTKLATGGADAVARVIDVTTGQLQHRLRHDEAVNGVAWDPGNANRLATASSDGYVGIWNVSKGKKTLYSGHKGAVTSVSWSSSGLASGSADKSIIIWQV